MATLDHDGLRFVFTCTFAERKIAVDAGCDWSKDERLWYTTDLAVAARLRDYASALVLRKNLPRLITISPWTLPLPRPPKGLAYKEHQIKAGLFSLGRNNSYLRLDPGLGKTIVATMIALAQRGSILYITPPSLALNVESEFQLWAPELKTSIVRAKKDVDLSSDVLILPDSIVGRDEVMELVAYFGATARRATIIVDEAHRFKNSRSGRSSGLFTIAEHFDKQVYMTGTPLPNRPIELYSILSFAAPETIGFKNENRYAIRYCGAHYDKWGWNIKGASNMPELKRNVLAPTGPFMLKMTKALLKLPPKTESVLVVGSKLRGKVAKLDRLAREEYGDKIDELIATKLAATIGRDSVAMPTYRRLLGIEKAPLVAAHVRPILSDGVAVLVFAQHLEVVDRLAELLAKWQPFIITGKTPMKKRKAQVDEFQRNPDRPLFIGNITAMGEGNTLTKATRVVIAEPDWVPGKNTQAGDRAHRIGQNRPVHVEYVVYKNSLDKVVIETLLKKRQAISHL